MNIQLSTSHLSLETCKEIAKEIYDKLQKDVPSILEAFRNNSVENSYTCSKWGFTNLDYGKTYNVFNCVFAINGQSYFRILKDNNDVKIHNIYPVIKSIAYGRYGFGEDIYISHFWTVSPITLPTKKIGIEFLNESNDWIKSHEFHKKIADNTPSMIIRKWAKDENGNKTNTVLEKVMVLGGITTATGFKAFGEASEVFHETATNTVLKDTYKRVASVDGTRLNSIVNEAKKAVMSQKPVSELGKITPKSGYAFAQGSSALMSTLGFVAKLGKYVMPLASFLLISKSLGAPDDVTGEAFMKEFETPDSVVTAKKFDKKAYDDAIKEYWEEKLDEYEKSKDKDNLPDDQAEAEKEAQKEEEAQKQEQEKQLRELEKQNLENEVKNIEKKNTILDQEAKRKGLKSSNQKDWAEQDLDAYEKQYSDEVAEEYTTQEGTQVQIKKGVKNNVLPDVKSKIEIHTQQKSLNEYEKIKGEDDFDWDTSLDDLFMTFGLDVGEYDIKDLDFKNIISMLTNIKGVKND